MVGGLNIFHPATPNIWTIIAMHCVYENILQWLDRWSYLCIGILNTFTFHQLTSKCAKFSRALLGARWLFAPSSHVLPLSSLFLCHQLHTSKRLLIYQTQLFIFCVCYSDKPRDLRPPTAVCYLLFEVFKTFILRILPILTSFFNKYFGRSLHCYWLTSLQWLVDQLKGVVIF